MGKFSKLVLRNGDQVLEGRGSRIIRSAQIAQKALCDKLEDEIIQLEDKREAMLDQSPDNRFSLKIGEAFEASKWAAEYQMLSVAIVNKKVEHKIASENMIELFETDEPAVTNA